MTTTLCNYTAYVGFDDRDILVQHIVDLFAAEGMQRVDRPKGRSLDEPALKCNHWIVAVHQGKPGWIVLSTSPWDLMADQAPGHANSRLFDLCQA